MTDRPKIHVFLGAPPPPPPPPPPPTGPCLSAPLEAGPPGPWRTLELSWQAGRLRPPGEEGAREALGGEGGAGGRDGEREAGRHLRRLGRQDPRDTQRRPRETTPAEPPRAALTPPPPPPCQGEQTTTNDTEEEEEEEEEELCSVSVSEYLDSCFPAAQPDPGPESNPDPDPDPGPDPGSNPDPDPGRERGSPRSHVSAETEYLAAWTVSHALLLRGGWGGGGVRPETTTTSSSAELYSPVSPTPCPGDTAGPGENQQQQEEEEEVGPGETQKEEEEEEEEGPGRPQQGSMEELFFSEPLLSRRQAEEAGVILEATPEGLLCSQGGDPGEEGRGVVSKEPPSPPAPHRPPAHTPTSPAHTSPVSPPPAPKRRRVSPASARGTEGPPNPLGGCRTTTTPLGALGGCRATTTPLGVLRGTTTTPLGALGGTTTTTPLAALAALAGTRGQQRYSVLVAVLHPCHLKEVRVRRGAAAGSSVPLASLVVTDQSDVEMKVVLWRKAAFWVLTVFPGDVLLITGVTVSEDRWRGETVLQSSYSSRLLNLGQVTSLCCPAVPPSVHGGTLRSLCAHLCVRCPLLTALPPRPPQTSIPHCRLDALRPDTLVHALLRVTHTQRTTAWRAEAEGWSRSGRELKAVLSVQQGDHQGAVVLWGAALGWLQRLHAHRDALWEFRVLLVREGMTSGLLELHSTPWASCQLRPPPGPPRLPDPPARPRPSLEIDLSTLLSEKYTGDVELRVQILAFQFQGGGGPSPSSPSPSSSSSSSSQDALRPSSSSSSPPSQDAVRWLDGHTPLATILDALSGDVSFAGCGRCGAELDTDANGIYCPCYPCLPHTGLRRYYRPGVLKVREQESQVCVKVPPVLLQKMLLNTPPDRLSKTVAPGSKVRHAQLVADRIHSFLSLPRRTFLLTVRSHFLSDENSVTTLQDFLLLNFTST